MKIIDTELSVVRNKQPTYMQNANNFSANSREVKREQKAVANCVWMLVVKIEGIERIY